MKIFIFILYIVVIFCGCYPRWPRGYGYWGDRNEIADCNRCSSIKDISKDIEYLNIDEWNCRSIPLNWNFPYLKELTVVANRVKFPASSPCSNLEIVSIISPILDSIPPFIFELDQLEGLIIFLRDDKKLDNQNLSKLKNLRQLKIGLSDMSSIPSFIYSLDSLEELVIFSNTPNKEILFEERLINLKNLRTLEAPVELSRNLNILSKLPNLEKLSVRSLRSFDENIPLLTQLSHLNELCLKEILPEQRMSIAEIIPSVNFICRDWHLKPLAWGSVPKLKK